MSKSYFDTGERIIDFTKVTDFKYGQSKTGEFFKVTLWVGETEHYAWADKAETLKAAYEAYLKERDTMEWIGSYSIVNSEHYKRDETPDPYECQHRGCTRGKFTTKRARREHEEKCEYDPARKTCLTCSKAPCERLADYRPEDFHFRMCEDHAGD
jgi:hypothetical protein